MNNETKRTLPHPGSAEASAMMDSVLAEYNWPANSKNAARAGWEAANLWIVTGQARASAATQAVPEPVAYLVDWADVGEGPARSLFYDTDARKAMESAVRHGRSINRAATVTPLYAAPVVPPVALPALTDEWREEVMRRVFDYGRARVDVDRSNSGHNNKACGEAIRAIRSILAASAAPAPEQMQPNAGADDAARLDWLEKHLFAKHWNGVIDSGSRTDWTMAGPYRHTMQKMNGNTLREAIDAALSAVPPTVKE